MSENGAGPTKLPSKTLSSNSLLSGERVLQGQQVKCEPDIEAMEAEMQDLCCHRFAVGCRNWFFERP